MIQSGDFTKPFYLWALAVLLACTALFSACTHDSAPQTERMERVDGKASVAVMPFIKGRDPRNLAQTLSCPFDNFCYEKTELDPAADQILTEMLQEKLMSSLEERIFPLKRVRQVYFPMHLDYPESTPLNMAQKLGNELGVDYVVVGNVWRFRERVGSSMGVSEPASVAFALYLVSVKEGEAVWQGRFNETQQSLSENVLKAPEFFKRGARWLKARVLARYGIDELLREFPLK